MTSAVAIAPPRTFLRISINEWKRKAVHMGAFSGAFLLPYLTPAQAILGALGAFCFNAFLLPKLVPSIFRQNEMGQATGALEIILYPAAVLATILAFGTPVEWSRWNPAQVMFVMAVWFYLAIYDALLGICHALFRGSRALPWNNRKNVAGLLVASAMLSLLISTARAIWEYKSFELPFQLEVFALGFVLYFIFNATIGLWESLWFGIDDNLTIPFLLSVGLLQLFLLARFIAPEYLHPAPFRVPSALLLLGIPTIFSIGAWAAKKITLGGALFGWGVAFFLIFANPWLFAFLLAFFILGVTATRYGKEKKSVLGIAEAREGRRGIAEIFGAAGVAVWLTPLAFLIRTSDHFTGVENIACLVIISPLIAKTMDTVSSEMGKAIGGKTISLRSFKLVPPGTEGAVSLAGTLWGIAAAAGLAALILPLHWGGLKEVGLLVAIAIAASLFESYWGVWAAERGLDDGPHTNFLMTLFAATLAWFVWLWR